MFHYGHTTGACQVSDVGLHKPFKATYLDVEARLFPGRQLADVADIGRSAQEVGAYSLSRAYI